MEASQPCYWLSLTMTSLSDCCWLTHQNCSAYCRNQRNQSERGEGYRTKISGQRWGINERTGPSRSDFIDSLHAFLPEQPDTLTLSSAQTHLWSFSLILREPSVLPRPLERRCRRAAPARSRPGWPAQSLRASWRRCPARLANGRDGDVRPPRLRAAGVHGSWLRAAGFRSSRCSEPASRSLPANKSHRVCDLA